MNPWISLSTIAWIDVVAMIIVLGLALDQLRVMHFSSSPVRSIAYALLSIGAFAQAVACINGRAVAWYDIALHLGFAAYGLRMFVLSYSCRRSTDVIDYRVLRKNPH